MKRVNLSAEDAVKAVRPRRKRRHSGGGVNDAAAEPATETAAVLLGAGLGAVDLMWRASRPVRLASTGVVRFATRVMARVAPTTAAELSRRGQSGRADVERGIDELLGFVISRVAAAFLATIDLTALVREHVDLDAIAAGIDVDKIVGRVDFDAAIGRIDLDAVAGGLDVDKVVARVDLDAIVHRIDLVGIAREVVDAIDLAEIIRQSTGALTSDSVRTIRTEAMHADDVLGGVVDRLLRRAHPRPDAPTVR